MMTVSSILHQTASAKMAHERWVKRADHLISGLPVEKQFIPLDPTSCEFGKWFYSQGSQLRVLDSLKEILSDIETQHDKLHQIYGEIYKIYFIVPHNRSFLHKVITFNSKEVKKSEKEKAITYYKSLSHTSDLLLSLLDKFELEVRELGYHNAFKDFK